jgi:hypothetical protein
MNIELLSKTGLHHNQEHEGVFSLLPQLRHRDHGLLHCKQGDTHEYNGFRATWRCGPGLLVEALDGDAVRHVIVSVMDEGNNEQDGLINSINGEGEEDKESKKSGVLKSPQPTCQFDIMVSLLPSNAGKSTSASL